MVVPLGASPVTSGWFSFAGEAGVVDSTVGAPMVVAASIFRTRLLPWSAKSRSPDGLASRPIGWLSWERYAGPPSPEKPFEPPAIVVIVPEELTLRTRWLEKSLMKRLPDESTKMP